MGALQLLVNHTLFKEMAVGVQRKIHLGCIDNNDKGERV